ncbi:MAG: DNA-binding response regulator [Lewinellaceae bacterium]|nr:DNA-binding response regulator [Saprospiraceae bacterium]MCB9339713.1 DNA-binding response regulator [Lewinellaceae bacterium]
MASLIKFKVFRERFKMAAPHLSLKCPMIKSFFFRFPSRGSHLCNSLFFSPQLFLGSSMFLLLPSVLQNPWPFVWLLLIVLLLGNGVAFYLFYQRILSLKRQLSQLGQTNQLSAAQQQQVANPTEEVFDKPFLAGMQHGENNYILLIESDAERMGELVNQLGDHFRVDAVQTARQGISTALETIPDVIIINLALPDINGLEVCEMLKTNGLTAHIPILALSSAGGFDDTLLALQKGADTCMDISSLRAEELIAKVRKLMQSRELLRHKFRPGLARKPTGKVASYDQIFLDRLHQVIEKHLNDEGFSTIQLSEEMGMSRTQLHRKMTELLEQPAGEYIKNFRLDHAYFMLQNGQEKVQDVMERVGYTKMSYFTEQFKKKHGITPNRLRQISN